MQFFPNFSLAKRKVNKYTNILHIHSKIIHDDCFILYPHSQSSGNFAPHVCTSVCRSVIAPLRRSFLGGAPPLRHNNSMWKTGLGVREWYKHELPHTHLPLSSLSSTADSVTQQTPGRSRSLWRVCRIWCSGSRAPPVGLTECFLKAWRGLCWYFSISHGDWESGSPTFTSSPRWCLTSDCRWVFSRWPQVWENFTYVTVSPEAFCFWVDSAVGSSAGCLKTEWGATK